MTEAARTVVRELDREESESILARNHVARLAYCYQDRVGIAPIHYVFTPDWLYGRTSAGSKLETATHNWRVAVEVDEVEGLFDWRSVVVGGGFYVLSPERSPEDRAQWELGVQHVRRLVPAAFTEADPLPERTILFRIAVQEVTGRESSLVNADPDIEASQSRREAER